jgi:chaperonin GroEL (HSP60 family)
MGDATNMVIVLAGELLKKAEDLLRTGLKPSDIVQGYERAGKYALDVLEGVFNYIPLLDGANFIGRAIYRQGEGHEISVRAQQGYSDRHCIETIG